MHYDVGCCVTGSCAVACLRLSLPVQLAHVMQRSAAWHGTQQMQQRMHSSHLDISKSGFTFRFLKQTAVNLRQQSGKQTLGENKEKKREKKKTCMPKR